MINNDTLSDYGWLVIQQVNIIAGNEKFPVLPLGATVKAVDSKTLRVKLKHLYSDKREFTEKNVKDLKERLSYNRLYKEGDDYCFEFKI